jgi:DNA-binding beta-propeller fold protein YncE
VDGGQIHRANVDGTGAAVIASLGPDANPRGIVVDGLGGRVFWADYDQNAIFKSDLDGLGITAVVPGSISTPWGLALDPGGAALYFTEYSTGLIRRFALPAGPLTTPVSGLANPTYLAIEAGTGKMYWSEAGAGAQKVQRANLDGTLIQNLGLPLQTYGGIAVGPGQPTATLLVMLTAAAVPDGIEVRWRFTDPGSFTAIEVERADGGSASWQVVDAVVRQEAGVTIALDHDVAAGHTYQYRLSATGPGGVVTRFGPVPATAGGEVVAFALAPVTPNPSRGVARIDYAVAREARVRLSVIDVLGREVARLVDGTRTPGRHQAIWTGDAQRGRARAGLYFVRYETPAQVFVRRLVLAP